MSEPEIARRCHACGASIRDHAAFCPQCGKELKISAELNESGPDQAKATNAADTAPLHEAPFKKEPLKAEDSAANPDKQSKEVSKTTAPSTPGRPSGKPWDQMKGRPSQASPAKGTPEQAGKAQGTQRGQVVAEPRSKMQRATGLAKNVGGDVVQRGQKLREMSSVVLDEAGYDPSLRFVLVAAALFFLFLVIVLLNRFIV